MSPKETLLEALRSRGRHLTRQRRLVLKILEESQEHLDAETLYSRAKAHDPHIGLATVYRSLALLKEAGLVQEHPFGEDHGHFEVNPPSPHFHFTCLGCGQVIEFQAPQVVERAIKLCEKQGLQVTEFHLRLSGYCTECQNPPARAAGEGTQDEQ